MDHLGSFAANRTKMAINAKISNEEVHFNNFSVEKTSLKCFILIDYFRRKYLKTRREDSMGSFELFDSFLIKNILKLVIRSIVVCTYY